MSTLAATVYPKVVNYTVSPEDRRIESLEFLAYEYYLTGVQKIKEFLEIDSNGKLLARIERGLHKKESWAWELVYDAELDRKERAALANDLDMLEDLFFQDRDQY